jgi:integrase
VSSIWGEIAASLGTLEITFHSLRHTHASQLIASNVDIVTISKRLGHVKRAPRLRSTPICFIPTTARLPKPSRRLWANDWLAFGWQSAFLFPSCSSEKMAKYLQ